MVRALIEPLRAEGWRLLHRRRWPGTRRADIDHLLVGPGGVFLLDSKNWRGDVRVSGGRLWQGDDDVSDQVEGLADQLTAVEAALVDEGLAPLEIVGALVFVGKNLPLTNLGRAHLLSDGDLLRWLRARGTRLRPADIVRTAAALERAAPPVDEAPVVPAARPRPRPRPVEEQGALFPVQQLDLTELERASRKPLEDWMVYLHPSQLSAVRRRYEGPCRVRGPAGCGKTVVALHRAAYLAAQEPGELLFLSYVRTLPVVLSNLFSRLAPQAADRVRFSGVHQLAVAILREAGVRHRLDRAAAETCFNLAWVRTGRMHLERDDLPVEYWRDEVLGVIKGRGLDDFEDYRNLARTGRRTPLSADQRRRVWDLYVAYEELLAERGVQDFQDVVALALDVAGRGEVRRYRFVLVDEAQDLDLLS
ncbi:MAG TPA: NERD domain-containing protein, partial [Mycobacteriales bacterium]|nr:NERD domain-containing protein [Mycobacteriales bacterium]